MTGGGYNMPGITAPTVTFMAGLLEVPEVLETISLESSHKAVEPAVPVETAPAQVPERCDDRAGCVDCGGGRGRHHHRFWFYKRREKE